MRAKNSVCSIFKVGKVYYFVFGNNRTQKRFDELAGVFFANQIHQTLIDFVANVYR